MARSSVSNLVAKGSKKATKAVGDVATKSVEVVSSVATSSSNAVEGTVSKTSKGVSKVARKVKGLCNMNNIIPCVIAVTLIAYIVIVSPATVLDLFSTKLGKALSMSVVLIALLFDVKMGVMLGLAVILSISLSSVKKDIHESFGAPYPFKAAFKPKASCVEESFVSAPPQGPSPRGGPGLPDTMRDGNYEEKVKVSGRTVHMGADKSLNKLPPKPIDTTEYCGQIISGYNSEDRDGELIKGPYVGDCDDKIHILDAETSTLTKVTPSTVSIAEPPLKEGFVAPVDEEVDSAPGDVTGFDTTSCKYATFSSVSS
tara:strand:+ start:5148 stop:6089 length:942 start_codon:yes stop_codon:yes gene_type:complete